ncbi:MAG: DUF6112 family protein [Bifidobacteriaceae bacterium]|nr:DUF6112 family protein [Bifidobacteriaceae bacterium]
MTGVAPDFTAVDQTSLGEVVGALLTIALVAAAGSLIVSAVCWAAGESQGNWQLAARGKTGALVSVCAAGLAGAGIAWANWLIAIGQQL